MSKDCHQTIAFLATGSEARGKQFKFSEEKEEKLRIEKEETGKLEITEKLVTTQREKDLSS